MRTRMSTAIMLALGASAITAQTVVPIDVPGALHTRPNGINSSGEITGVYVKPDNSIHGFLLDRNGFMTLDVPGAIQTNAFKINPQGDIAGFYNVAPGRSRGFLW